jgi:aryl-alcohol dehydrogenase-like predicted oxidoreductase
MLIADHCVEGIGLGTAQFAFRDGSAADSAATVHAALDAGVRLIDTALAYTRPGFESYAEQVIATALHGVTIDRPLIATKGGHWRQGDHQPDDLPTARACAERGVVYLAYKAFGGPSAALPEAALAIARRRGVSPHRVLLGWLREQSPNIIPLVGASRPESIRDSAVPLALTREDLTDLRTARHPVTSA